VRVLLVALNTRYNQTNPALLALRHVCSDLAGAETKELQLTINQTKDEQIAAIYRHRPQAVAFSVYLWNVNQAAALSRTLKVIIPDIIIVWGGPEAAGAAAKWLRTEPSVDFIINGEGEVAFPALLEHILQKNPVQEVPGLVWRCGEVIKSNPLPPYVDLGQQPPLYGKEDLSLYSNKIIYYESSRGCPSGCTFCTSAREKLRFAPLDKVKSELSALIASGVKIVKFVDRTFNADSARGAELLQFLLDKYRPNLVWHLELDPRSLQEPLIAVLQKAPPGYFQVECGVQSLNPAALKAVNRHDRWPELKAAVLSLLQNDNVHVHLDLLAGLPGEDWESLSAGFYQVHAIGAHYLQLGFLKVLPGTVLSEQAVQLGLWQEPDPPYSVLYTSVLPFSQMLRARQAEKALDLYYNDGGFRQTLSWLARRLGPQLLNFYAEAADYIDEQAGGLPSVAAKAELLYQFLIARFPAEQPLVRDLLRWDWYSFRRERIPAALEGEDDSVNIIKDHLPEVTAWRPELSALPAHKWTSHIKAVRFKHLPAAWPPGVWFFDRQKRCGVTGLLAHYYNG